MSSGYILGYSVGGLLAGFIFVIPFALAGKLWNRKFPNRSIHAWSLPMCLSVVFMGMAVYRTSLKVEDHGDDLIMLLSFVPVFIFCLTRWFRWRKSASDPDLQRG